MKELKEQLFGIKTSTSFFKFRESSIRFLSLQISDEVQLDRLSRIYEIENFGTLKNLTLR